jgi:hypothetical protein
LKVLLPEIEVVEAVVLVITHPEPNIVNQVLVVMVLVLGPQLMQLQISEEVVVVVIDTLAVTMVQMEVLE